ncbi:hypothetical protein [Spirillospora sp. CA-294931]
MIYADVPFTGAVRRTVEEHWKAHARPGPRPVRAFAEHGLFRGR